MASAQLDFKGRDPGWVTVYAPQATKPLRKIVAGIGRPIALALDPSDNLYVANGGEGSVTVYAAGGTTLLQTITKGINVVLTLAIH